MDNIKVIIDTKEKKLIEIVKADNDLITHCSFENLTVGDIHIFYLGKIVQIIERKTICDLSRSIIDKRISSQKFRLSKFCFDLGIPINCISFLIEGFFVQKNSYDGDLCLMNPNEKISGILYKALQQMLVDMETRDGFNIIHTYDQYGTYNYIKQKIKCLKKYGFHILNQNNPTQQLENNKLVNECIKNLDAKENDTEGGNSKENDAKENDTEGENNAKENNAKENNAKENNINKKIGEFILSNVHIDKKSNITYSSCFYNQLAIIPGISIMKAKKIVDYYKTLPNFIDELKKQDIKKLKINSLGKVLSKRVYDFIFQIKDDRDNHNLNKL